VFFPTGANLWLIFVSHFLSPSMMSFQELAIAVVLISCCRVWLSLSSAFSGCRQPFAHLSFPVCAIKPSWECVQ
jgi:hypothetical protein